MEHLENPPDAVGAMPQDIDNQVAVVNESQIVTYNAESNGISIAPGKPNIWIDKTRSNTGREVVVQWKHLTPIPTEYSVSWHPNNGDSPRSTTENETLIKLELGLTYTLSVKGVNEGEPGEDSNKLRYRSAPRPPKITEISQDTNDAILVKFEDPYTNQTKYKVTVMNTATRKLFGEEKIEKKYYTVNALEPGSQYEVFVQAFQDNEEFGTFESPKAYYHSPYTLRPPPPSGFKCKPLEGGGYQLSWDSVMRARRFLVKWSSGGPDKPNSKVIHSTSCYLNADELKPGQHYEISVNPINDKEEEMDPVVQQFDTNPTPPYNICVDATHGTEDSVLVTFEDLTAIQISYLVEAEPDETEDIIPITTKRHFAELSGLQAGKNYEIFVTAQYKDKRSRKVRYEKRIHTRPSKVEGLKIVRSSTECRATWKKSKGADNYIVTLKEHRQTNNDKEGSTKDLQFHFEDLAPQCEYTITIQAQNDVGRSSECQQLFVTASPGPQNLRMRLISGTKAIIECDDCPSATAYYFKITYQFNGLKPAEEERHTTEKDKPPKYEISVQGWRELTVEVRTESESGSSDFSSRKFRNVISIIQQHFCGIAANILPKKKYIKPQFLIKLSKNSPADFDSSVSPKTGEIVVVQAGWFCGKTSLCSYFIQTDAISRLPLFVDADKFSSVEKLDYKSFFGKCIGGLNDDELTMLLDWMEKHSQDIVFIVDNAQFLGKTPELIEQRNEKATAFRLLGNIINPQRLVFREAVVLCTAPLYAQFQIVKLTRVLEITGFVESDIQNMASRIGNEIQISKRHAYLCENPGFCSAILESIALHRNFTSVGETMMEIIEKLMRNLYDDLLRKQKISNLREKIVAVGQNSDIAPRNKARPKSARGFTNIAKKEPSCKSLENEYQTDLYYAFFMPSQEFDKCFQHGSTPMNEHSRKWEMIAGLLRKDVYEKGEALFMEKLNGRKEKSEAMKQFVRSKADKIKSGILKSPEIAAHWYNCAFELADEDLIKKLEVHIKVKNQEDKEKYDTFYCHIAEDLKKWIIMTDLKIHRKSKLLGKN